MGWSLLELPALVSTSQVNEGAFREPTHLTRTMICLSDVAISLGHRASFSSRVDLTCKWYGSLRSLNFSWFDYTCMYNVSCFALDFLHSLCVCCVLLCILAWTFLTDWSWAIVCGCTSWQLSVCLHIGSGEFDWGLLENLVHRQFWGSTCVYILLYRDMIVALKTQSEFLLHGSFSSCDLLPSDALLPLLVCHKSVTDPSILHGESYVNCCGIWTTSCFFLQVCVCFHFDWLICRVFLQLPALNLIVCFSTVVAMSSWFFGSGCYFDLSKCLAVSPLALVQHFVKLGLHFWGCLIGIAAPPATWALVNTSPTILAVTPYCPRPWAPFCWWWILCTLSSVLMALRLLNIK